MPDVFGLGRVNRIFGDVLRVIADTFEMTRDKNQTQVTRDFFGRFAMIRVTSFAISWFI